MKKIYQIPEIDVVFPELSKYILAEGSPVDIDPEHQMSNEVSFEEGEMSTGANSSLWED